MTLVQSKQLSTNVLLTDQTRNWAINQNAGGFTLTNLATPVNPSDAATKAYVDSFQNGISWKQPALARGSTNVASLSGPQTVGGTALVAGNRVLLTGQSTATENGLWVVQAGAWTRPTDFAVGSSAAGSAVWVETGTSADTAYVCTTDPPNDIVGTNNLTFVQFGGVGTYTASTGLTLVGSDFRLIQTAVTPSAVSAAAAVVGTSQEAAHADHTHQVSTGTPTDVGAANSAGVATTLVRSDHVHFAGNQIIQVSATPVAAVRNKLNFVGSGVTITPTDNGSDTTTLTFTVTGGGTSPKNQSQLSPVNSTGNAFSTTLTLTTTSNGATQVSINGQQAFVQATAVAAGSVTGDCFWSSDGGVNSIANNNVPNTAVLYWAGTNAGFQLATTDRVTFNYNA